MKEEKYSIYAPGIQDGLDKLRKYYCLFDDKPLFILAICKFILIHLIPCALIVRVIVLHPYFKLDYIVKVWGGEEEQRADIRKGKKKAVNWRKEAETIIRRAVSV